MSGYFILYPSALPKDFLPPKKTSVPLFDALGLELTEDIFASENIPPYSVSLRDGWAVSSGCLAVLHEEAAVVNGDDPLRLGEQACRWINTGGYLPIGADAVYSSESGAKPESGKCVYPGENVLEAGSEWKKGDCLLRASSIIGASESALLIEAGVQRVPVYARPSVAILATGHEIVENGFSPESVRHSSNAHYLQQLFCGLGLTDVSLFFAPDNAVTIADRISLLKDTYRLIVTVGGTGTGRSDMLRKAIIKAGGTPIDDGAALCSSLPFVCARLGKSSLLGLPGNPLGFAALSQRLALPLVWQAFRTDPYPRRFVSVVMGFDAEAKAGDICVQLAPHGADLIALPIQKATGRSCVFRDMRAFIPNAGGQALPAGARVQAELFFNGLLF